MAGILYQPLICLCCCCYVWGGKGTGALDCLSLTVVSKHEARRKLGSYPGMISRWFPREGYSTADRDHCQLLWLWGFPSRFLLSFQSLFLYLIVKCKQDGFCSLAFIDSFIFFLYECNKETWKNSGQAQVNEEKSQNHCFHRYWCSPRILSIRFLKFNFVCSQGYLHVV